MAFDSPILIAAAALFAACVGGWWLAAPLKAAVRMPLRLGVVLMSALAVAAVLGLGEITAILLLPLASALLALAALARFVRPAGPLVASLALGIALACGLVALVTGYAMPGLVVMVLAGICMALSALQALAWPAILAGVAWLAMGLCLLASGVSAGLLLFAAVTIVGLARPSQSLRSTSKAARAAVLP